MLNSPSQHIDNLRFQKEESRYTVYISWSGLSPARNRTWDWRVRGDRYYHHTTGGCLCQLFCSRRSWCWGCIIILYIGPTKYIDSSRILLRPHQEDEKIHVCFVNNSWDRVKMNSGNSKANPLRTNRNQNSLSNVSDLIYRIDWLGRTSYILGQSWHLPTRLNHLCCLTPVCSVVSALLIKVDYIYNSPIRSPEADNT